MSSSQTILGLRFPSKEVLETYLTNHENTNTEFCKTNKLNAALANFFEHQTIIQPLQVYRGVKFMLYPYLVKEPLQNQICIYRKTTRALIDYLVNPTTCRS